MRFWLVSGCLCGLGACSTAGDDGEEINSSGGASADGENADSSDPASAGGSSVDSASAGRSSLDEIDPDPSSCGGAYPSPCASDSVCQFNTTCGTVGDCVRRHKTCDDIDAPVCGCDGTTYENACVAHSQGISVQSNGPCSPAEEQFHCGEYICEPGNYCLDKGADRTGRFVCLTLPDECGGIPSCECIGDTVICTLGQTCGVDGKQVTVSCLRPTAE